MSKKKKGKKPFQAPANPDGGLSKKILDLFKKQSEKSFDYKYVLEKLKIEDTKTRNKVIRLLGQLTAKGQLKHVEDKKFQFDGLEDFHTGIIDMTSRGDAYVIVEDMENDIYISNKNLNHALDGDEVKIYVFKKREHAKSEGEVVSILTRNKTDFVGVLHKQEKFGFVVVSSSKMYTDIFVPNDKMHDAKDGLLVKVRILQWKDKDDSPKGEITEVLGVPGEHETEMHAILAGYGLPEQFPPEVEEFANGIDTKIHPSEIKKRRDLRDTLTFTIDPADAKDFDDALSFKKMDNGNFEIGIHIADVAHYLQPGTILDDEAYNRATSIYLVDRVVPMLPEILSNGACSLRPH